MTPQLFMRKPSIDDLKPLEIPDGFRVHTHIDGAMDEAWEDLIEEAFERRFSFDTCIRNGGGYKPEYVFYVSQGEKLLSTATGVEKEDFPGEGWFRMVGTRPSARGLGAGKLVLNAVLHDLKKRGYNSVVLSTDDERLPAISLYLSLGFEPLMTHESHPQRWEKVFAQLNAHKKP